MNKKNLPIIIGVAVVLVLAIVLGVVFLGGNSTDDKNTTKPSDTTEAAEYKLGMGVTFDELKSDEISATVASVVLDKDGKIVLCRIDAVKNTFKIDFDAETFTFTELRTKMEQGDDYNMAKYGQSMDWNGDGIVKEWYEQAKAFEAYVVGKTAAEVAAMPTQTLENGYIISNEKDLLDAGCTIQITSFKDAVVKACNDDQGTTFQTDKTFTLGVAANSADNGSAFDDNGCNIAMNVEFAASVVIDGKIVASLNDAIQPTVSVDWDGKVTKVTDGKFEENFKTKREKKEDYGMGGKPYSPDHNGDGIVKEWYEQSKAFSDFVVGMTAKDVEDMPTQVFPDDGYVISADKDLLDAGCTIQITSIKAVVAESVNNAR